MQIMQQKSLKQSAKKQSRYDDNFSSREIIERPLFLVVVKAVKTKKGNLPPYFRPQIAFLFWRGF